MAKYGIMAIEMECSILFTVGLVRQITTGGILIASNYVVCGVLVLPSSSPTRQPLRRPRVCDKHCSIRSWDLPYDGRDLFHSADKPDLDVRARRRLRPGVKKVLNPFHHSRISHSHRRTTRSPLTSPLRTWLPPSIWCVHRCPSTQLSLVSRTLQRCGFRCCICCAPDAGASCMRSQNVPFIILGPICCDPDTFDSCMRSQKSAHCLWFLLYWPTGVLILAHAANAICACRAPRSCWTRLWTSARNEDGRARATAIILLERGPNFSREHRTLREQALFDRGKRKLSRARDLNRSNCKLWVTGAAVRGMRFFAVASHGPHGVLAAAGIGPYYRGMLTKHGNNFLTPILPISGQRDVPAHHCCHARPTFIFVYMPYTDYSSIH